MALSSILEVNQAVSRYCLPDSRSEEELANLLAEAHWEQELIDAAVKEDKLSREHLLHLISKNNDVENLETALRTFLAARAMRIAKTDLGYISYPHSPMNQLCMKLARLVKDEDEALVTILIPSLKKGVEYIVGNLKELTENDSSVLLVCEFVLSDDLHLIIPIYPWFEMQKMHEQLQRDHYAYAPGSTTLYRLSQKELETLKASASPASTEYFDALMKQHEIAADQDTLAGAVQALCEGLKGGSHEGGGVVDEAGQAAGVAIAKFIEIWNNVLTSEQRDRISALQVKQKVSQDPQASTKTRKGKKRQDFELAMEEQLAATAILENPSFESAKTFGQFYQFLFKYECAGQLYRKFQEILNAHFEVFAGIDLRPERLVQMNVPVGINHELYLKKVRERLEQKREILKGYLETKNTQLGVNALNRVYGQTPQLFEDLQKYEIIVRNDTTPSAVPHPLLKRHNTEARQVEAEDASQKSPTKKRNVSKD